MLARHVLQQGGIGDRKLCDYVASLLETFSHASRLQISEETHHLAEQYISDILIALNRATPEQAFLLRAHIGNYSLFISGIFHENTQRRSLRGGPDIKFYEQVGRTNYQLVSSHVVARRCELDDVFEEIGRPISRGPAGAESAFRSVAESGRRRAPLAFFVNETLFSQIQRLFERTYAQVGINLEDCLIDRTRSAQLSMLAGTSARELSELARTFLRRAGDQLYVGIYYSRWLIEQLEQHDPRAGLGDRNIRSLITFVEELNHALHAALQFKRGVREIASEDFARNLELQAQVDTYLVLLLFVAFFRKRNASRRPTAAGCVFIFSRGNVPRHFATRTCAAVTSRPASLRPATHSFLDTLNAVRRLDEIRRFHSLDYSGKKTRILALMDSAAD